MQRNTQKDMQGQVYSHCHMLLLLCFGQFLINYSLDFDSLFIQSHGTQRFFFDMNGFSRTDKTYSTSTSYRAQTVLPCHSHPMSVKASFVQFHCPVTGCDEINLKHSCQLVPKLSHGYNCGYYYCVQEVMKSYKPELFVLK